MGVQWKTRLEKFFDRPSAVHLLRQSSGKLSAKDLEELAALTLPCHEGMRCAPLPFSGDDHSRYERNCLNLCARGRPHKLSPGCETGRGKIIYYCHHGSGSLLWNSSSSGSDVAEDLSGRILGFDTDATRAFAKIAAERVR